ncbi:MAG: hypothetical protein MUO60_01660 [Clostridiaceae bacterium]|nr:hypothetical protein [Clostridiaceae bacterium]
MIKSYIKENYSSYLLNNYKTIVKVNFYDSVFSRIIQITRVVFIGIIVILSAKQLNYLGISLGMVTASIELIYNLFAPIENLGMELQNIQQAVSGIHRVNDFYNLPEDKCTRGELKGLDIIPTRNDIRLYFNNVTFQYEKGTDTLKNINLNLKPQERHFLLKTFILISIFKISLNMSVIIFL